MAPDYLAMLLIVATVNCPIDELSPIRCRPMKCRFSTTIHWRPVTFRAALRTHSSRQLSRRRDLIPRMPLNTGLSLIFHFWFYQSFWNDSLLAS